MEPKMKDGGVSQKFAYSYFLPAMGWVFYSKLNLTEIKFKGEGGKMAPWFKADATAELLQWMPCYT